MRIKALGQYRCPRDRSTSPVGRHRAIPIGWTCSRAKIVTCCWPSPRSQLSVLVSLAITSPKSTPLLASRKASLWVLHAVLFQILVGVSERVCVPLCACIGRCSWPSRISDQQCCSSKPSLPLRSKLRLQDEWKKLVLLENRTCCVLKCSANKHESQNLKAF